MSKQPDFPFDMTGYTCFSIINCPVEQAIQLLKEYPGLCAAVDRVPFSFRIAALPEDATWTLLRWIGEDVFPQEYFFNGRGYSSTGFQLEWLKNPERITDWIECSIEMEKCTNNR